MSEDARWWKLRDLFDHVPVDNQAKGQLFDEMNGATRLYHGVAHLELLWRRHLEYSPRVGLNEPAIETLIACAIAFHDSVYSRSESNNEQKSAEYWLRASAKSPLSREDREWVADTIRATADHLGYASRTKASNANGGIRERARLWVLDLDLTPLGEQPEVFAENTRLLRSEAADMPDLEWREALKKFYRRFLNAPHIYRFAEIAEDFEDQARRNLASQALDRSGP